MIGGIDSARYWRRKARSLALRVNAGRWLARFVPLLAASALVGAVALILIRRSGASQGLFWSAFGVWILAASAVAAFSGRGSYFSRRDALVHFDVALSLYNRLTSASAGVGPWPSPPERFSDGLRWRWPRIALPLLFSVVLLGITVRIPISRSEVEPALAPEEPLAWKQMESMLESVRKEGIVDKAGIAGWETKIAELRRRPEESWYSHSSLEAGDTLHDQLEEALRSLAHDLDQAGEALGAMSALDGRAREEALDRLSKQFDGALSGLEMGALPLDKELMQGLKGLDLKNLRALTPEEVEELRRRLKQGVKACRLGPGEGEGDDALIVLAQGGGTGEVSRGPGSVPLWLSPAATQLGSHRVETVAGDDLSHAALGELVGIGRGEHRVDRGAYQGTSPGGGIGSRGSGGEAVWKSSLTPEEQRVLRRYFK